jgi:hypothetical protein
MRRITRLWIVVVLMSGGGSLLHAKELPLVAGGKPNAVIVAAAEPQAVRAAAEVQSYLEKMSGAKLLIVTEPETAVGRLPVTIAVGHTKLAIRNAVQIPSGFKEVVGDPKVFEEEGFVLTTKGSVIILGGKSDGPYQGTLYAASEFLERLGCRWYFPGKWGEVVPEKKTITFPETNLISATCRAELGVIQQNVPFVEPSATAQIPCNLTAVSNCRMQPYDATKSPMRRGAFDETSRETL